MHSRVRDFLVARFGEPDQVRGRWFYEFGERFSNGILLLSGTIASRDKERGLEDESHDFQGTICVDVPGGALDDLDSLERSQLCHDLILGGRVSRIDLAVDCHSRSRVGLIDAMIASCQSGELCGAKRWEPRYAFNGSDPAGYGVTIGRRGNQGSGRYVRAYDKGLESGEQLIGQWERYEVEFSGDAAAEAAADVFRDVPGWEPRAWSRVCGAVDYRQDDASNGELQRRDRCAWWAEFIEGVQPLPTVPVRVGTTLLRHARWLRETVLPTVARLADAVGLSWADALVELVGHDLKPRSSDKYMKVMLAEWHRHLAGWIVNVDGPHEFIGARQVAAV